MLWARACLADRQFHPEEVAAAVHVGLLDADLIAAGKARRRRVGQHGAGTSAALQAASRLAGAKRGYPARSNTAAVPCAGRWLTRSCGTPRELQSGLTAAAKVSSVVPPAATVRASAGASCTCGRHTTSASIAWGRQITPASRQAFSARASGSKPPEATLCRRRAPARGRAGTAG
jgi:hypothetical protein